MKTISELNSEADKCIMRERRASMRAHAIEYRKAIHPNFDCGYATFERRTSHAVFYLGLAINYRNQAARYAAAV